MLDERHHVVQAAEFSAKIIYAADTIMIDKLLILVIIIISETELRAIWS